MIKLPAPRLLPTTILVIAALLGTKATSLGLAAMADDPPASKMIAPNPMAAKTPLPSKPSQALDPRLSAHAANETSTAVATGVTQPDWSLLQDLRARRAALDRRERDLDLREAAMQAEKEMVSAQLASLSQGRDELKRLEAARQERSDASWASTVKLYESMKPADAAAIFDTLELHLLVQIIDRMNARKAAAIMGNMDPDRARVATQALATYRVRRDADPFSAAGSGAIRTPGAG